jgi:hypothetical protein
MADIKAMFARMGAFEWIILAILVLGVLLGATYIVHMNG